MFLFLSLSSSSPHHAFAALGLSIGLHRGLASLALLVLCATMDGDRNSPTKQEALNRHCHTSRRAQSMTSLERKRRIAILAAFF